MVKPFTFIAALILSSAPFGYSTDFPTPFNNKVKSMIKLNQLVPQMPTVKFFGLHVAIDENMAVVGSEDGKEILVFEKMNDNWNYIARLTTSTNDHLGPVAISGDTVAVGSPYDMGDNFGSIFIFTKPASGWHDMTETAVLTSSQPQSHDLLGGFIKMDDDTIVTLINYSNPFMGLYLDLTTNARVLVYQKPESGWSNITETAELTVTDQADTVLETFGYALAIQDDLIFVGAPGEDRLINGGDVRLMNTGAVYVYQRNGATWQDMTETQKIAYNAPTSKEMFGGIIDINNDTLIIGTYPHDEHLNRRIMVFEKPANGWLDVVISQGVPLKAGFIRTIDSVGRHAVVGNDIVIANSYDMRSKGDSKAIFIFEKPDNGWQPVNHYFTAMYPTMSIDDENFAIVSSATEPAAFITSTESFGGSMAISGNHLIVGDYFTNEGEWDGLAYILELNLDNETKIPAWALY